MISLPSHLGGLGIINPCISSAFQFEALQRVTGPLLSLLLGQDFRFTIGTLNEQLALKQEIHRENHRRSEELESAASLHPLLSMELQRARELACACVKGASRWLTVLPDINMVFHYTRVILMMLYVSVMVGHYHTFQRSVFVVLHSQLIMPLLVLMVVIPLFTTMRSEILLSVNVRGVS